MAMRAGSNLGSVYDQNRLQSMQQFATTGMGLATAADTGLNQRIAGQETLAGLTDKGANDRVATANTVDQGTLNKTLGGQNASSVAQSAEEKRLSGGLTSSQSLASDQATLVGFGLSQAQSEQFTTDLQAIQLGLSKGTLTFNQAMAQATEKANLPTTASNSYFQYWLASKLMGGSTSSYSPDVSTGNSGTASTTGFDANGNYTGGVA